MSITIRTTKSQIDWQAVAELLLHFGLCDYSASEAELVFKNSYAVVFVYDGERLVGCGRALSDGLSQAAIYNIALEEAYQGRQLGRAIIESLLDQVRGCNVILYTHPKTVELYERLGFRRQKTGMAIYAESEEKVQWMEDIGFLLPEGYRFGDNEYEQKNEKTGKK